MKIFVQSGRRMIFLSNNKLCTNTKLESNNIIDASKLNRKIVGVQKLSTYLKCPISGSNLEVNLQESNKITLNADYLEYTQVEGVWMISEDKADIKL